MTPLTAIDVCAGAGGWAVAARGLPIRIVAAFDHAEDCLATYGRNHPGIELVHGDVTCAEFAKWKGVDLVLGGIPCEQVSAARRCRPLADADYQKWVSLLLRFLALPTEVGAAWWCYEDVRDVLRHIPNDVPHFTLDSQDFSGQRRKRVYLGNLPSPLKLSLDPRTFADAMRAGPHRVNPRLLERSPKRSFVYGGDPKRRDELAKGFYPWEPGEKSPTVTALDSRHDNYAAARLPNGSGWRQLEWQELAVLQGFPSDYVFMGSAGRVTKMVAQAVQIDTARAILQALCSKVYDL